MSINAEQWEASIGDPTIIGWITVAAYFIVSLICLRAAFIIKTDNIKLGKKKSINIFWLFLTLSLISLGINKQLDFQTLLTQIGRNLAIEHGWYKDRRMVQMIFIIFIGVLGVTGATLLLRTYRHADSAIKIAFSGCVILFVFILIRASSFHHMDMFINMNLIDIRMNAVLELGGLVIIGIGGFRYIQLNN